MLFEIRLWQNVAKALKKNVGNVRSKIVEPSTIITLDVFTRE